MNKNDILSGKAISEDNEKTLTNVIAILKENAGLSLALRNGVYLKLLKQNEFALAELILSEIIKENSNDITFLKDIVSLSLKQKKLDKAIENVEILLAIAPNDLKISILALQTYLQAKENIKAEIIALSVKELWGSNSRLCLFSMNALYRAKNYNMACSAGKVLIGLSPITLEHVTAAAGVLLSCNYVSEAKTSLLASGALNSDDPSALFELGRAFDLSKNNISEVIGVLEKCTFISPYHYSCLLYTSPSPRD